MAPLSCGQATDILPLKCHHFSAYQEQIPTDRDCLFQHKYIIHYKGNKRLMLATA